MRLSAAANAAATAHLISPFEELLKASDQQLFDKIILNQFHLLYTLVPPPSVASQNYITSMTESTIDKYPITLDTSLIQIS